MKDLKHLFFFEKLLLDTENELIRRAKAEGRVIIGMNCYQLPEVLLNLPGCAAVRMRAPRTGSLEIGTYYMTSLNCEYCRALVERCTEGGLQLPRLHFRRLRLQPDGRRQRQHREAASVRQGQSPFLCRPCGHAHQGR